MPHVIAYIAALVALGVLDFIWLGFIAKDLYRETIGHLLAPDVNWLGALGFYFLYPVGVVIFAVMPQVAAGDWMRAALMGGLFGLFCYATYDLSNLATLKGYPVKIALIDIGWGVFITAVSSGVSAFATQKFA